MQEVGERIFGDVNYSYTVSLIHRCYNFSGQNSGKYMNGCRFEKTYGYRVTRKDIEAFVKRYPNGTFNDEITFESFLLTRVKSAQSVGNRQRREPVQRVNLQQQQYYDQDTNYSGGGQTGNVQVELIMLGIGIIGVLILTVMFSMGIFLKHWIIGVIVLLFTIGGFSAKTAIDDGRTDGKYMPIGGIILEVILIRMFLNGTFFRHWVIGLILLCITGACYAAFYDA